MSGKKICTKCGLQKELPCFGKRYDSNGHIGIRSFCRKCDVIRRQKTPGYQAALLRKRAWRKTEKAKKYDQNYAKREASKLRVKENHLKRCYGISFKEYNDLFDLQNGCCAICLRHQAELKRRLAVDHCHATGKIRGLLCYKCNVALGLLGDRIDLIDSAKRYLLGAP